MLREESLDRRRERNDRAAREGKLFVILATGLSGTISSSDSSISGLHAMSAADDRSARLTTALRARPSDPTNCRNAPPTNDITTFLRHSPPRSTHTAPSQNDL